MRWVLIAALILGFLWGLSLLRPSPVQAACHSIDVTWYSPTGIAGCEVYGEGTASMYPGSGVARNDCEYPWTDCTPIRITSLQTGRSLDVTPSMYCDCYTGTSDERIVDLDPAAVEALGLNPAEGLWPVRVEPLNGSRNQTLPDTSTR